VSKAASALLPSLKGSVFRINVSRGDTRLLMVSIGDAEKLSSSGVAVLGFLSELIIVFRSELWCCGYFIPLLSATCSCYTKGADFSAGLGSVSKGQTHFCLHWDLSIESPEFISVWVKVCAAQNSKLLAFFWPPIEQGSGQFGVWRCELLSSGECCRWSCPIRAT